MGYFTNFKDRQLMKQVRLFENDGFLNWYEYRFGKQKTQKLRAESEKEHKSPFLYSNPKIQLLYLDSEHSGGAWLRYKNQD